MNILQILPELKSGGVERGTVDLAKHLMQKGHKAYVVSAGGPLVEELKKAGVIHYKLPVHKKSLWAILQCVKEVKKIVKDNSIDLMHARSRVPALVAFLVSRSTWVPFVTTCHGFYSKHFLSRVMGWGKLVIVASHSVAKRMRDDFNVPFNKLRLIHRGVDLEEFKHKDLFDPTHSSKPTKEIVIGMIGRLTPIKGHEFFLKAMARVVRVYPDIKIQIVGEGPKAQYKESLELLVTRLGLSSHVQFLGTRYDIPEILSKMSVLVVPSVGEEAFGRVAIEAGACGVPVIATRMGGLVDIIENEKNGLLVPPNDPRLLSEAVIRIIRNPALAKSFSLSLRKKVEDEFTLNVMLEKTLEVYKEAISQRRILVIKISAMGDVILSIPSLRALREKFPEAWIAVLVGRKSRQIARNCPYVNDTLVYEEAQGVGRLAHVMRMAKILAKEDYDIVIDLQNNRTSHLLAYLCSKGVRAGHQNHKWSFLLNRQAEQDNAFPLSPVEHQFRVLRLIGIEEADRRLELWSTPEEDKKIRDFLELNWVSSSQILVGMNPGSSVRWSTKQWPVENFSKICDELAKKNIRVVITGSKEEAPLAQRLIDGTKNKPINAVGKTTLTELTSLIKRCQVFISSDSAPMHIASSVNTPLVALFGPTDPHRHCVPPDLCEVFFKEINCSPCYLRSCPIGLVCMKKITVAEVLEAVYRMIYTDKGPKNVNSVENFNLKTSQGSLV